MTGLVVVVNEVKIIIFGGSGQSGKMTGFVVVVNEVKIMNLVVVVKMVK